ncbi:hypothetical protein [Streptomyces violaceusniger]|uniref:Alanine dehydrogenase/pyridine nucleotide transhydrogenase NAD(H)-binding domain-containing protein n=1 Tax=Streptomyces violaceusniger (strain Tu 4113) TaxID=653045 RepID=G2P3C7_STRV4|nr:hypothetical protein Strvi_3316 [Streptomyces violaceusniger Tu 4113]
MELRGSGLAESVATAESAPAFPSAVYEADLVVTAVSGGKAVLDVDRLRPGTVVVDDSSRTVSTPHAPSPGCAGSAMC